MKRFGQAPSPSLVISLIALFVALGGTGYAALKLPRNSVGTKQLKTGAVSSAKIKKGAVTTAKLKNRAVTKAKLNVAGVTVPNATHASSADTATSATTAGGAPPTGAAGGALTGSYPGPTIAAAPTPVSIAANPDGSTDPCAQPAPQTHIFCGKDSTGFWAAGVYSDNGVQIWRDHLGEMHIRGEARFSTTYPSSGSILFYLPPSERPAMLETFPIATGDSAGAFQAGSGLLWVYPTESGGLSASSGAVSMVDPGHAGGSTVFLGEIEFRTDA